MNADNVMTALALLRSNCEDFPECAEKLVSLLVKPYESMALNEKDDAKLCMFLAAKANYHLCIIDEKESIKSFKAGEVSISTGSSLASAKELLDMSYKDVAHIVDVDNFAFLEV